MSLDDFLLLRACNSKSRLRFSVIFEKELDTDRIPQRRHGIAFCQCTDQAAVSHGLLLGPVGGRLVAEVFIGLLQLDPDSYLSVQPNWVPTVPTHDGMPQSFRMIDFLTFAGVDPTSRGQ